MTIVDEAIQHRVHTLLGCLVRTLELRGVSTTLPTTPDGTVSVPMAWGMVCGANHKESNNEYADLLDVVHGTRRARFVVGWEFLEVALGDDLVTCGGRTSEEIIETLGDAVDLLKSVSPSIDFLRLNI